MTEISYDSPLHIKAEPPATVQKVLSWIILLVAGFVSLGWLIGNQGLMSVVEGFPTMKINTALGFLLIAIGLVCPGQFRASLRLQISGWALVVFMAVTLLQYPLSADFGIDQWIMNDPFSEVFPGRPSIATCVTFICLGLAMGLDGAGIAQRLLYASLLLGTLIPLMALVIYLFNPGDIMGSAFFETMAIHTVLLFLFSASSILLRQLPALIPTESHVSVGRRQFERLLMPVLLGPIALGVVVYNMIASGKMAAGFGMGLFVAVFAVVTLSALIWNSTQESLWYQKLMQTESERLATYQKLSSVLDIIRGGILYLAADGTIRESSARAAEMFGFRFKELNGRNVREFIPEVGLPRFEQTFANMTKDRRLRHYHHKMFRMYLNHRDGKRFTVLVTVGPVEQPSGSVMGVWLMKAHSIEKQFQQLRREVRTDHLTSAGTRASLEGRLNELESYGSRDESPVGIIMLDIDHFKAINDRYGHLAGDQILADFARRVDDTLRYSDTLYRYGGEEFVVVVIGAEQQALMNLAERIRKKVAEFAFHWQDERIAVTCSLGVTMHNGSESYIETLERVDSGLYEAKGAGRNRSVMV